MPIIKSAIKRVKQANQRRERNIGLKKDIKAATKAFMAKPSADSLSKVQSTLDTAVKKNLLEKNTVARKKAQFSKIAKEAGVKLGAAKKAPTKKPAAKKTTAAKATTAAKKPAAKKTTTKTAAKAPAKKSTAKKTTK